MDRCSVCSNVGTVTICDRERPECECKAADLLICSYLSVSCGCRYELPLKAVHIHRSLLKWFRDLTIMPRGCLPAEVLPCKSTVWASLLKCTQQ